MSPARTATKRRGARSATTTGALLSRVVFPEHGDVQALPLYLDPETWSWNYLPDTDDDKLAKVRGVFQEGRNRLAVRLTHRAGLDWLRGRRGLELPAGERVSLASYFNAFPASYWKSWTSLTRVILRVVTRGPGRIAVYRSNARGVIQRVEGREVTGEATSDFVLPLTAFIDGGWLWFDLIAEQEPLALVTADWFAPADEGPRVDGRATVSITTLNRGAYCSKLLVDIGSDDEARAILDRVLVVDQGSQPLEDDPGFPAAREVLGDTLTVIRQANLGGSGGFARGMLETLDAATSEHIVLLDDDVEIESESLRRAIVFANWTRRPTLVGGHMFDMYDKAKLHAFAEGIYWKPFFWGPITPGRHDLGDSNLRQSTWMHRRYDVDYNGWWMEVIPLEVIRRIGLALPVFIKWDDAEYSLRAADAGYATVSFPGAAVWHVSWVDKDDSHDWQSFFHARNRLVAGLLHSPLRKGGKLMRANLAGDMKNLLTMDYYTTAMRHEAIRNVLQGPEQLHDDMVTRLARVRDAAKRFTETTVITDPEQIASLLARQGSSALASDEVAGPRGPALAAWLVRTAIRHALVPVSARARRRPELHLAYQDARWFEVPEHDSVLITGADGVGVTLHRRSPRRFRRLLVAAWRLNTAYRRDWDALSARYRRALPDVVSPERWRRTFDEHGHV